MNEILAELRALMKNPPDDKTWARFCKYIDPIDWMSCWQWQNGRTGRYPKFNIDGVVKGAHVWICYWLHGTTAATPIIDHLWCSNNQCANGLHLLPTTTRANALRSITSPSAVNSRRTHCTNGHLLSESNLYPVSGSTKRRCKECAQREARERLRRTRRADSQKR